MPVETTDVPAGIVAYLKKANNPFGIQNAQPPNTYWVTSICKCLRQSYYRLSGTPSDVENNNSLNLWSMQSGKYLHSLTHSYRWRELDVEREFHCPEIDEILHICGRLDMYDYKNQSIIDLKTTNAVNWQHEKGLLPRQSDVFQIQCYGSLFSQIIKVSSLTLLYADMKNLLAFKVPIIDMFEWMRLRMLQIHISSFITKSPPPAEVSDLCSFCQFKIRCKRDGSP